MKRCTRRTFLRAVWVSTGLIFVPRLIRAQVNDLGDPQFLARLIPPAGNTTVSGLIHDWILKDHTSDTISDLVGGKDLTNHSGTFVSDGLTFNGSNQWADTAAWLVGANNISIICWAKFTASGQQAMFVEKETVNAQWELFLNTGGALSLRGGGATNTAVNSVFSGFNDGIWHQFVGTISGTTGLIYMDNGLANPILQTVDAFTDASSSMAVGRFNSGYYFAGTIGRVQIYNRSITATEVGNLWTAQRGDFGV